MISNIKTKGFKGPDINQPCTKTMVFVGPNRSGKTSRTNGIHLALNGFIATAHDVCKKPRDILNQYAKDDFLTSAIEINGTEFEWHIFRKESGTVSKRFRINKAKYSEKEYMAELVSAGNPKIIDLSNFIDMSDAKKIDTLFKLFPADVDIKKLNSDIAREETKKKRHSSDIKTKKAVITENTKAKNEIELPAGTLAEVRADIEDIEKQYRECRDKITLAKKAAADAEKPVENQESGNGYVTPDFTANAMHHINEYDKASQNEAIHTGNYIEYPMPNNTEPDPVLDKKISATMSELNRSPIDSLTRVLTAMEDSGCQVCAAKMVLKKEIRGYKS